MSTIDLTTLEESLIQQICEYHKGDEFHLPFEEIVETAVRSAFSQGQQHVKTQLVAQLAEQLGVDVLDVASATVIQ